MSFFPAKRRILTPHASAAYSDDLKIHSGNPEISAARGLTCHIILYS